MYRRLNTVARLVEATVDDVVLVAEPSGGQAQCSVQMAQGGTAQIPQLDPFQVVPDALIGIQIRRVAWQDLKLEACRATGRQERLHRLAMMDGSTVPDHQQLARDVTQQVLQEPNHLRTPNRTLVDHQEQAVVQGDAADDRQVVAGQRHAQDGRLRPWRVAADHRRQQIEAGLVYPDDALTGALRPLLSAGQRLAYQAAMAASSRWVARTTGFWGLQPIARKRRLTCDGW